MWGSLDNRSVYLNLKCSETVGNIFAYWSYTASGSAGERTLSHETHAIYLTKCISQKDRVLGEYSRKMGEL